MESEKHTVTLLVVKAGHIAHFEIAMMIYCVSELLYLIRKNKSLGIKVANRSVYRAVQLSTTKRKHSNIVCIRFLYNY